MTIKYLFDRFITEEEKIVFKRMTCQIPGSTQSGIYFTKKQKDLKPTDFYCDEIFSNCNSIFFISTNELSEIKDLSMILGFLIHQSNVGTDKSEYHVFATRENNDVLKLAIVKYVYYSFDKKSYGYKQNGNYTPQPSQTTETIKTSLKFVRVSVSYFVEIIDKQIKIFNVQLKSGCYDTNIEFYTQKPNSYETVQNKIDFKEPINNMNIFKGDQEYYNLMDLYTDFCDEYNTKSKVDTSEFSIPFNLVDKKKIVISTKSGQFAINFSNCNNFIDMINWIKNKFGDGELCFDVDLKNNEETIKYLCL